MNSDLEYQPDPELVFNVRQRLDVGVFPSQWSAFDTAFTQPAPTVGPRWTLSGP